MIPDGVFLYRVLVFPGFLFLLAFTLFCDWFERKVMARMQNRMGPSYAGPFGLLQPLADYVKLLMKEDVTPLHVRNFLFTLAPMLSFSLFMLSIFSLPWDGGNVFSEYGFEGDLLFVLALVALAHFFLFLSGWSSSNPYGEMGAVRIITQFLGYDIPLIISALGPAFLAGSLSLARIASSQTVPFALLTPWVFTIFLISLQAELEEDPFDVPHAETEIVAGYGTEFSGRKLAFIRLSKDLQIVFGAALAATLFLGGPYGPALSDPPGLWFTAYFIVKVLLVIALMVLIEAVCARLRIDHIIRGNWLIVTPAALVSVIISALLSPHIRIFMEAPI
jgi:NADH-quinone oxidoreductase subunit H